MASDTQHEGARTCSSRRAMATAAAFLAIFGLMAGTIWNHDRRPASAWLDMPFTTLVQRQLHDGRGNARSFRAVDSDAMLDDEEHLAMDAKQSHHSVVRRTLQADNDDFRAFNDLFRNAKIHLPDEKLVKKIVVNEFILDVSNVLCYNVRLDDLSVDYFYGIAKVLTLDMSLQVSMDCTMDYWYGFGSLRGSGQLMVQTSRNSLDSVLKIGPGATATAPPTVTMDTCAAAIDIVDLDFDGGVVAKIADIMQKMIATIVEKQVSTLICDQLSGVGSNMLKDGIAKLNQRITPYLNAVPRSPLQLERATVFVPNIINLQAESGLGSLLSIAIRQLDSFLGGRVRDVGGPTGTGSDLALNVMMRNKLLNADRSLDVKMSGIANPVILNRSDKMTDSVITIDAVKVYGLDTLKKFSGIDIIGNRTLQSVLQWDYLTVHVDMTVAMKASSQKDSIIEGSGSKEVVEQISIVLGVEDLHVAVALLVALNDNKLGALQLGSLLFSDRLVPCLLSALDDLTVTRLNVTVSNIHDPTIKGFVSPGIDQVISQLVKAALTVYEPTILRAIPGAFQILVRDTINKRFIPDLLSSATCKPPTINDDFVDMRDLLLAPAMARFRGGSGQQQYGDVGHLLYQAVKETLTAPGGDGLMGVNNMLLRPMTLAQSGTEGLLRLQSKFVSFEKEDVMLLAVDRLEVSLSDLRVDNVDAVRAPFDLFQPTDRPFHTNTTLRVGNLYHDKLTATVRLFLALIGDESPLQMLNELDISATVNSVTLESVIRSMISAKDFQQFQLRYITNIHCWLSLFPLGTNGEAPLKVSSLAAILASFSMNASCISCTSSGTSAIPDLVDIMVVSRAFPVLAKGIESLAESFAQDASMNNMLRQMVEDAHQLCPARSDYDASAKVYSWVMELPSLPMKTLDSFIFGAAIAAQTGVTVFALSHQRPHPYQDALSAQASFRVPNGIRLLDWTNLETSLGIGTLPDSVYKEVRGTLNQVDDSGKLFINSALDESLLQNGVLMISPAVSVELGGIMLTIEDVEISGLNSFSTFDVLNPIGPQTLQNTLQLDSLGLKLTITVVSAHGASQRISLSFQATDISVDLVLFAAFDLEKMGSVTMESFFALSAVLPCLLSTAHSFEIPRFIVKVGAFSQPLVEGLLPSSSKAMSSIFGGIADRFGENMTAAIPYIFDGTIKGVISSVVSELIVSNSACDKRSRMDAPVFVDFRDLLLSKERSKQLGGSGLAPYGSLFKRLFSLVKARFLRVDPVSGLSKVNDVITKVTEAQSGSPGRLDFPDPFSTKTRIQVGGLDANVQLRVYDAYIDEIDTVGAPFSLLSPVMNSPNTLNNTATIGAGPPLEAGGRFMFGLSGDDLDISNDIQIAVGIDDLSAVATALLQVEDSAFRGFPIRDVLNQYCWLATIPAQPLDEHGVRFQTTEPSLRLQHLSARIAQLNLNVTCIDCSSPGLSELSALLSTRAAKISVTKSVNNLLEYMSRQLGGAYLQTTFDRLLVESHRRCPHSEDYEADPAAVRYAPFATPKEEGSFALFLALALTVLVIAAVVWVIIFIIRFIVKRRNRRWLREQQSLVLQRLLHLQRENQVREHFINESTTSLFKSPEIPRWVRLFMPVCIIGNIGLFLSGHLSLGATVTIVATIGEQTVQAANFYEFSVARSTIEIWKAGGKALALLILIVSGIWPYTKQLVTLVLWFMPSRSISVSRRGSIFLWFDTLAKWSFVDIFVLVVTVAGFRVSVQSPDVDFLPKKFYSLDLLVVPLWGLYANMIAQIISQISSHYIVHYHRRVVEAAKKAGMDDRGLLKAAETGLTVVESGSVIDSDDDSLMDCKECAPRDAKESLYSHAFSRPHRGELDRLTVRRNVNRMIVPFATVIALLVILGCTLPVVSQEVLGIIGIMVESGQDFDNASASYSLFSIIGMLFEQAAFTGRVADYIGLGSLSIVLISCVLIVPIVQTGALIYQWFAPMAERRRRRMLVAIECLEAWQYCEVFILAVVVAAWQLGPVSEFMVGSSCESLKDTFAQLVYYGFLKPEDAQCFRVDSLLAPGAFVLAGGALLLTLLNVFIKMAVTQYFRDTQDVPEAIVEGDTDKQTDAELIDKIEPALVLFTDRFRWCLRRVPPCQDDLSNSSSLSIAAYPESSIASFACSDNPS